MNIYVNTTIADKNRGGVHIRKERSPSRFSTIIVQLTPGDHGIRLRER